MTWDHFIYFAFFALFFWAMGSILALKQENKKFAIISTLIGLAVFGLFILFLWVSLERPPLRTMGETRLWYAFFLPFAGLITYIRWRYQWVLFFTTLLSGIFVFINLLKPDIHNKVLMPALQSPWFAPHVIIYMFSYAILGAATIVAIYYLFKKDKVHSLEGIMEVSDNLVYIGTAFITIAMLLGAIWAKMAWGHYWSWDPKETWAAATWLAYLIYIHYRLKSKSSNTVSMLILIIAFFLLQMCWWGINYLPSAKGRSVHTYSSR